MAEVRAAIKTVLEAAIAAPFFVHSKLAGVTNPPAVVVKPADADYEVAFGRGVDTWNYDLIVLASLADDATAQEKLDELVDGGGTKSIRKAIFNNRTLGLANTDAHISGMSDYDGRHTVGTLTYAGAVLRLVVHTQPS